MNEYRGLMIGEKAPHFEADTTYGKICFPEDYKGKWVIFFSHPGDLARVAAQTNPPRKSGNSHRPSPILTVFDAPRHRLHRVSYCL